MKKLIALCMAAMLMLCFVPITAEAASENVTLTITADKSTANPGDTINYSVSIGKVNGMGGLEFVLDIPSGLTISDESIVIPAGIASVLDSDGDIVKPSKTSNYKWSYSSQSTGYKGDSDLTILTFSCTVDSNSVFEAKSVTAINAKSIDNTVAMNDHTVSVVPASVTIEKAPVSVTGVSLNSSSLSMKDGETQTLTATVAPADADNKNVKWSSSDTSVATVSDAGVVSAVKEGSAVITVTTVDGSKTAKCSVTVSCSHVLKKTEAVEPTCGAAGNIEYYTCSKCSKKFSNENGENAITDITKPATGNHTKEIRNAVAATEDAEGYTGDTYCSVCGNKLATGTTIARLPHTHVMEYTEAKTASCEEDGNIAYYTCTKCKKMFTDENGTNEVTKVVVSGHIESDKWGHDEENHWKVCENCGKQLNIAKHVYLWVVDKEATLYAEGEKHEECECGLKRNEHTVIAKLTHEHTGITYHGAVASTCSKTGNVEYWTCGDEYCTGKYYADSKCQIELTNIVVPVDKNNHVYDDDNDAYCNQCGYQRFYQVIDGANETIIAETGSVLTLRVNGEYELFDFVKVDGTVVNPKYYTVTKGSTIITFNSAYLDTLDKEVHSVEVWYTDGKSAKTQFTLKDEDSSDEEIADSTSSQNNNGVQMRSPKTGENGGMSTVILVCIAASGCVVANILRKRKNID